MELSTKSGLAPKDHVLHGWTIVEPGELLRYIESGKGRPNKGLSTWHNGERPGENGRTYNVYGVTRSGDGFHTVLTMAALDTSGISDAAVEKLALQAAEFGVPFDSTDPDIAHIGVTAVDFDARDISTPKKAVTAVMEFEDTMAAFITSARDAGLLVGVPLGVHNTNQLNA